MIPNQPNPKIRRCTTCGYIEIGGADKCPNCDELVDGKRRALGKGLDALLPSVLPALDQANRDAFEHSKRVHVRIEGLLKMEKELGALIDWQEMSHNERIIAQVLEYLIQWQLEDLKGQG